MPYSMALHPSTIALIEQGGRGRFVEAVMWAEWAKMHLRRLMPYSIKLDEIEKLAKCNVADNEGLAQTIFGENAFWALRACKTESYSLLDALLRIQYWFDSLTQLELLGYNDDEKYFCYRMCWGKEAKLVAVLDYVQRKRQGYSSPECPQGILYDFVLEERPHLKEVEQLEGFSKLLSGNYRVFVEVLNSYEKWHFSEVEDGLL